MRMNWSRAADSPEIQELSVRLVDEALREAWGNHDFPRKPRVTVHPMVAAALSRVSGWSLPCLAHPPLCRSTDWGHIVLTSDHRLHVDTVVIEELASPFLHEGAGL